MNALSIKRILIGISFTLLFIFSLPNSTYASRRISIEDLKLDLSKIKQDNLGIIVWDQRAPVKDRSQAESFLGYIRSLAQIAWPYFTKSNESLSNSLLTKIQEGYDQIGININTIETSALENENQILQKIKYSKNNRVLVIKLNELFFDGTMKLAYMANIELQLYNSKGDLIYTESLIKTVEIGSNSKRKKSVPNTLKLFFEELLNSPSYIEAMNSKSEVLQTENSTANYDLIIKRDGEEINAKILEIDDIKIKYKPSTHLDGPTRVINKSAVFMIKYKNGTKELFK